MMGPAIESSGGSAGNTMAGIASLGGNGAYIGKVRDDLLGEVFRHDMTAIGVHFDTPGRDQRPRHRALPDPGHPRRAAHDEHLSRRLRRRSDPTTSTPASSARRRSPISKAICSTRRWRKQAFRKAAAIAHAAGRQVALSPVRPVLRRAPSR